MKNLSTRFVTFFVLLTLLSVELVDAQRNTRWQQEIAYTMDIKVDAEAHQYTGTQQVVYTNNSPDVITKVYYHLFFNAFQPGSMMDVRSLTIADPDRRVRDRISKLQPDEIGYLHPTSLTQDGQPVEFTEEGTILVVELAEPLQPGQSTTLAMEMKAQVPLQIRRSGRDNAEGVEFSMSQWYPKVAAYDEDGWHPNPYIGREFYAPFGTFDVTIHIDPEYVVSATAVLQNPEEVGYGYTTAVGETPDMSAPSTNGELRRWHFMSENIHDFMWAADPDYIHTTAQVPGGPLLRFFYQQDVVAENADADRQAELTANWEQLPALTAQGFEYANKHFGQYPYPEYTVIQGGDGGMEYIMGTLITGNRSLRSLVGVTVHEFMHSWYQGALGINESYYYWMDEGFTSYATDEIMDQLFGGSSLSGYQGYAALANSGREEVMTTHADHFTANVAYGIAAYSKGAVFLGQAKYMLGEEVFARAMLRFFEEWKFKHPRGKDLLRIFEQEGDMILDWYYEYFVETTKTVDYAITSVSPVTQTTTEGSTTPAPQTEVTLERLGDFPMPLEVQVTGLNGQVWTFYIPLRLMRGEKTPNPEQVEGWMVQEDWPWVEPSYTFSVPVPTDEIVSITIDESMLLADVDRSNNTWEPSEE